MFKPASSKVSFPDLEKRVLQFWKDSDIFHLTEAQGDSRPLFMLYEGPPTANGSPGIHHVLARVFKDIICRYKTMKGYRCLRKGGWDTHGLPVELEVEKELGLKAKKDIEEYGIENFNQKCRESVFRYVKEWEDLTDRIGFWVDMQHPYVTLDNDYVETGWWILRRLWDKGLLYQDMKGTPHCPRCVTSLSSHEVALGYQENTPDPSVYIKFKVSTPIFEQGEGDTPTYFLAWTTTPWTLPGNTALAVAQDAEYSIIELERDSGLERLIIATDLVERTIREPFDFVTSLKGRDLIGFSYDKLYEPAVHSVEVKQFQRVMVTTSESEPAVEDIIENILSEGQKAPMDSHVEITIDTQGGVEGVIVSLESVEDFTPIVVGTDFVSLEDGTGIVHIAPAFGDEDLSTGKEHGLAFVQPVDLQGKITGTYPFAGKFVKDADEDIMADLKDRGLLYHRDIYHHTYPFCWRCDSPLLYYAKPSWYIRTTAAKEQLVEKNKQINWYPDYIKEGRFGEWLDNNVDWSISRERYWGTPIPLWKCGSCGEHHCIGSIAELKQMAVPEHADTVDNLDLHRPYVDRIAIQCTKCGGRMMRIPEVMDAWFDSGAMPFAQWHYPFEGQEMVQDGRFPADYICEAVDQTRGWFYSLHALSILLMDQTCYRNVICLGLILDGKGQKMSKRVGNVVNPWTVLDAQGADATRWYLFTAAQPGESRRFAQDLVNEVVRRFLLTLWNVYSFFTTYAAVDQFHPDQVAADWTPASELDRWILSELNSLVEQVDANLDTYNPTDAGRRIQEFVDRLSNWYVRRSRRRFWKSENDEDKLLAYATLHTCLTTTCKLIAPFMPFVAEEMYQNLVRSVDDSAPQSVHLADFPQASPDLVDQSLMEATNLAMRISSMGRGARSRAGIKVRQPVQTVVVLPRSATEVEQILSVKDQILDELNVKDLRVLSVQEGEDVAQLYQKAVEAHSKTPAKNPAKAPAKSGSESSETGNLQALVQVVQYWVSLEAGYMVALDTDIPPDLVEEGLARELVHRIQNIRRAAGLEITDKIVTFYQVPDDVRKVLDKFASYIQQETLSERLQEGEPPEGAHAESQKLEGIDVVLGVKRV